MPRPYGFSSEEASFMRLKADRLGSLAAMLAARKLKHSIMETGEARHLVVRIGSGRPRIAFIAHYDRAPDSPGTLDNSCACLQLLEFASRQARSPGSSFLVLFTDAEEAPGIGKASEQGSFALAKALVPAMARARGAAEGEGGAQALLALVLDVTGRGDRLLLSTAPASLLERGGRSDSAAAQGHRHLLGLATKAAANAALEPPLSVELPWSDDLGLTLGGMAALTVSLLPGAEARDLVSGQRPQTWNLLHTPQDEPGRAESEAFEAMAAFLDAFLLELDA
jgi:Peptidase family M28.